MKATHETPHHFPTPTRRQFITGAAIGIGSIGLAALVGIKASELAKPEEKSSQEKLPAITPILDFRLKPDNSVLWEPATATGKDGKQHQLTSEYFLPTVSARTDSSGLPMVQIELNDEGSLLIEELTKNNTGKTLGIFVDNSMVSAPTINGVISRNAGQPSKVNITGLTENDAKKLTDRLNQEIKARTGTKEEVISPQDSKKFKKHTSFTMPYEIMYPDNWDQSGESFNQILEHRKGLTVPASASVTSQEIPAWITSDVFKETVMEQLKKITNSANIPLKFKETKTKIDGIDAWKLETTLPESVFGSETRTVDYLFVKGGKGWVIDFKADSAIYDMESPTFQKMLQSFKLLK